MILPSFHCSSRQFHTISVHFRVFFAVAHEKVRKLALFQTHCLYIYIWVILLKTGQNCDIEGKNSKCEFFNAILEMKA